jgi:hypothetical protein
MQMLTTGAKLHEFQQKAWGPYRKLVAQERMALERQQKPSWELALEKQAAERYLVRALSIPDRPAEIERTSEGIRVVS